MLILDYSGAMDEAVGSVHGINSDDLSRHIDRYSAITHEIVKDRRAEKLAFLDLPYDSDVVNDIKAFAAQAREKFENFVVLGIGGSALGCIALHSALRHPYYNLREKPRMFFLDNIDPERTRGLLETLDPKKTCINVITKSGSTAETMANMLVFTGWLKKGVGDDFANHIVAVTDPEKGDLRALSNEMGITAFGIPLGVGGRFSVLSSVGLLPAAVSGIAVEKLLEGAQMVDLALGRSTAESDPAFIYSLLKFLLDTEKGKCISVLMPYSHALRDVADWYRQLWAESLGKKVDADGNEVNVGQTPIKALGTTDQHSQVQLYSEGPNNKVFTFLRVGKFRESVPIPNIFSEKASFGYLAGSTIQALLNAEADGTAAALRDAQRPSFTIETEEISEQVVGALLYFFELVTAYSGRLYNIDAFNQPGVEAGKLAAYALMGRDGYKEKRDSIRSKLTAKSKYRLSITRSDRLDSDDIIDVS
ncbi:MAG: glucose-6-phosphate isomerase [Planctomycetota bacterium]|jgi:glucose-6-phosphate isomerase